MSMKEIIEELQAENAQLREQNGQLRAENQQLREQVEQLGTRLHELEGRVAKVQQKISGTFRCDTGPTAFCRIRGYFSTMAKQGHRLYMVAHQLFAGVLLSPIGAV